MPSHKKKTPSVATLPLFPTNEKLETCSPSKNKLITSLTFKQEELRVGRLDYDRWRPLKKAICDAALDKTSNRAKINGDWLDMKYVKTLAKFLNNWARRENQLAWEINELRKEISDLEKAGL